jgi:glucose/arabinose dehydrogenase
MNRPLPHPLAFVLATLATLAALLGACSGGGGGGESADADADPAAPTAPAEPPAEPPAERALAEWRTLRDAASPITGWTYALRNDCGGKALTVADAATSDGAAAVAAIDASQLHQQWQLEPADAGYYYLRAGHSGQRLEVVDARPQQVAARDVAEQQWGITPVGYGRHQLEARSLPGQVLDVSGASPADGATLRLWPANSTCAQHWSFEPYGLTAEYFNGHELAPPALMRQDSQVGFDWGAGSPAPEISAAAFSARWRGRLVVPASGSHVFYLNADGGSRLFIDGRPVIDAWLADTGQEHTASVELQAGSMHDLRLEYFDGSGSATVRLEWSGPGLARQAVPATALRPAPAPGVGLPAPALPAPYATLSAEKLSHRTAWPKGRTPVAPAGFSVELWASGLSSPRWLYQLPNGDVLAALSRTGQAGEGRLALLRDADGNGRAEAQTDFLLNAAGNLNQPFGMALVGDWLYVANTDGLWRYPYRSGDAAIDAASGTRLLELPADGYNNHWTRNVIASADGRRLYLTVGSATNADTEFQDVRDPRRATILEYDIAAGTARVFAAGLRNPNGMDWEPATGRLWAAVNERDALGDDLVPDFVTSVREGAHYGWPHYYFGNHEDPRKAGERPDLAGRTTVPDLAVGAHTSTLGLAFYKGSAFPEHLRGGLFIGQRGSWNRSSFAGYRVAFVPFDAVGRVAGPAQDFLTGFMADEASGEMHGRPVCVLVLRDGSMLVSDDVAGRIWRVRYTGVTAAPPSVGGLMLTDAQSGLPLQALLDGATLDTAQLRTTSFGVLASSVAPLGSVRFTLDGQAQPIANQRPYAMTVGSAGARWTPAPGTHTLSVTPYSGADASGEAGSPLAVSFTVR